MDKSTWKKWERWWADVLGGDKVNAQRIPVTGRQSGDVPDVETIKFACEVKAGKVVSSRTLKAVDQAHLTTFLKITEPIRKEEMRIKASLDSSLDISI